MPLFTREIFSLLAPERRGSTMGPQEKCLADELRAVPASHLGQAQSQLDDLGEALAERLGLHGDGAGELARQLVRSYVVDRALVEAIELIDTHGEPDRGIQPFRDSLVHSLALTAIGRLLDESGQLPRPVDPNPDGVIQLLERAYRLLRGELTPTEEVQGPAADG